MEVAMTAPQRPPSSLWDRWLVAVVAAVAGYGAVLVAYGDAPAALFDRLGFGMTPAGITAGPARDHVLLVYGLIFAVGFAVPLAALRRRLVP
jgi:hypothetical protein